MEEPRQPIFMTPRHIKYWLRCLKTFLPTAYTPNDSQRMTFAFFTLSALDLLSALENHTTSEEREGYVDWIYHCQHPNGGFKGFTGADAGVESCWDPANLAATYFALASLIVLRDPMERLDTHRCLSWLRQLQREDGSFGEALGKDGQLEGGGDIRYCYLAAAVRSIVRRGESIKGVDDINVESLVSYVRSSVTYEGGIAKAPLHEAHAGWTYCGIGVLNMFGRLANETALENRSIGGTCMSDAQKLDLMQWLVSRQTLYLQEVDETNFEESPSKDADDQGEKSFHKDDSYPANSASTTHDSMQTTEIPPELLSCAGLNGRCNKVADTCYAFWVGASLSMLGNDHLLDSQATQKFLLTKTQHIIGGFGKLVGDSPDILHSYLGLAALSTMNYPDINNINPVLCISTSALQAFEEKRGAPQTSSLR